MHKSSDAFKKFDIYLVDMDPTKGHEISKTRPAVIVSPDEWEFLATVSIAPFTTTIRDHYPFRPQFDFQGVPNQIAIDQARAVDKTRLIKKIGTLPEKTIQEVVAVMLAAAAR